MELAYIASSCSLGVIEERHQVVSRVRDNSTENPSNISTSKAHSKLETFTALLFRCWNSMLVQ